MKELFTPHKAMCTAAVLLTGGFIIIKKILGRICIPHLFVSVAKPRMLAVRENLPKDDPQRPYVWVDGEQPKLNGLWGHPSHWYCTRLAADLLTKISKEKSHLSL